MQISFGVYVGLEEIDGAFLKDRFGTKDGVLIKPQLHSKFEYLGPYSENKATYDAIYKSKTKDGVEQLVELLRLFNTSDVAAIDKVFDWDMFLRTYVVEIMTGNWDGKTLFFV